MSGISCLQFDNLKPNETNTFCLSYPPTDICYPGPLPKVDRDTSKPCYIPVGPIQAQKKDELPPVGQSQNQLIPFKLRFDARLAQTNGSQNSSPALLSNNLRAKVNTQLLCLATAWLTINNLGLLTFSRKIQTYMNVCSNRMKSC